MPERRVWHSTGDLFAQYLIMVFVRARTKFNMKTMRTSALRWINKRGRSQRKLLTGWPLIIPIIKRSRRGQCKRAGTNPNNAAPWISGFTHVIERRTVTFPLHVHRENQRQWEKERELNYATSATARVWAAFLRLCFLRCACDSWPGLSVTLKEIKKLVCYNFYDVRRI